VQASIGVSLGVGIGVRRALALPLTECQYYAPDPSVSNRHPRVLTGPHVVRDRPYTDASCRRGRPGARWLSFHRQDDSALGVVVVRAIEVAGARIQVEEVGAGPPALVLHGGLGLDHHAYRSLDPLASALRLVYLDHRGNGRSTGDVATATMAQWAEDAAAVARDVGGEGGVIVIGHSFGGFIAQEMAIAHGAEVRALILVATTPGQLGDGERPAPDGPPMPAEFATMLSAMPESDDEYAALMRRLAPAYLHETPADVLVDLLRDTVFSAAAMRRGFEQLASWSSVDRLATVTAPVLLLAGRHDAFTAWPQSDRIASRLPDAEVVIFEHSAHFPWLEEPDLFFSSVLDWLRRRDLVDD